MTNDTRPSIFISYNSKVNDYVDRLELDLQEHAKIIRYTHNDSTGVGTWESFRNFMRTIREQDFAVLIISKEYLESDPCIYEVMQLWKDEKKWDDKVMYIVTENANIYNPFGRLAFVKYWQSVYDKFVKETAGVRIANIGGIADQAKRYQMYAANIGDFLEKVSDSNNPRKEDAAKKIIERIGKKWKYSQMCSQDETDSIKETLPPKIMNVVDENGMEETVEVILAFEFRDTKKEYVVYTKGEVDKHNNTTVYISEVDRTGETPLLMGVPDEAEWDRVREVLKELGGSDVDSPMFDEEGFEVL